MSETEFAIKEEDNGQFSDPSDTPDWEQPGVNVEVNSFSIENNRIRTRQPDKTSSERSRVGNFIGSVDVSWTMTDTNWHKMLPLESSSLKGSGRLANTVRVYTNSTIWDSSLTSSEEALVFGGCALESASVNYQEGELITVDATIGLGEAVTVPGPKPTVTQPAATEVYAHHGASLTVDSTTQAGLQSASLSQR